MLVANPFEQGKPRWGSALYEYDAFDMMVRHDDGLLSLTYVYTADDERIMTIKNPPLLTVKVSIP